MLELQIVVPYLVHEVGTRRKHACSCRSWSQKRRRRWGRGRRKIQHCIARYVILVIYLFFADLFLGQLHLLLEVFVELLLSLASSLVENGFFNNDSHDIFVC
jgi:hypothetical protein